MHPPVVQLVLKVDPRARERLHQFADDDGRNLSREFEHLMEKEAVRRLEDYQPLEVSPSE